MTKDKTLHKVPITSLGRLGSAFILTWERDFDFAPGQLAELALCEGGPSRLYSLFTGPGEGEAGILFNPVEGGALTPSLAGLAAGAEIWMGGPSGSFPALAGPGVWIANGTGIAPFVSMARAGFSGGKKLLHGARALEDFYFRDELEALMGEDYLRCCSSSDPASPVAGGLFPGRLTAFLEARSWEAEAIYELCGSASMVVDVRDLLIAKGVPHARIISEVYF
jgi:ferredoxin/flavodoxin---NADP+ reductase